MEENRDLSKLALAVIEKMASEAEEGSELHGNLLMAAELLDPSEPEVTKALAEQAEDDPAKDEEESEEHEEEPEEQSSGMAMGM